MVRWLKLFGDQYFGFWILGLVLFAVQEIPYMVMPLVKMEANPIMNMVETSAALDACEKVLGSLCIALMIFVVHRDAVLFSISEGRDKGSDPITELLQTLRGVRWTDKLCIHLVRSILLYLKSY